jgi:quercetin dioxygenase-like cupin family protein
VIVGIGPGVQEEPMLRLKGHRGDRAPHKVVFIATCGFVFGWIGSTSIDARGPGPLVDKVLSTGETVVGETITYPSRAVAKLTAAVVTLAPGEETGWHRHGMPVFGYVLEGELTVDYGVKGQRTYKMGEGFAEAINAPHNGRNMSKSRMRVLAVFMGEDGMPTTINLAK